MKKLILLAGTVILMISFMDYQSASKIGSDNMKLDFRKFICPPPATFTETVKTVSSNEIEKIPGEDIDQDWYQKVMKNIEKEEYNISYSEELDAYQSPNRENNIRFIYHKDGFTAVTRDVIRLRRSETGDVRRETLDEWSIDFKLSDVNRLRRSQMSSACSGVSRETHDLTNSTNLTNLTNLTKSELSVAGNKAYIEDENIRIDYTNDKEGMRQDFIIKKKPEGEGKLRLNISADTKLKKIVGADALMFKDKNGQEKMKYSALKCWDANGVELRAYFEESAQLQSAAGGSNSTSQIPNYKNPKSNPPAAYKDQKSFSIVVNDDEATYPITIDPLSANPEWTAESDQAGAEFGFSVATAGDVNGDGYSDVIVGAPKYDNGETDEGRAYVFHGSATGLTSTASWTAESNQENAQLGYCVATAGDVNGDGYSDALVGVPLYDNGQTDEGRINIYFGSASGLSEVINNFAEGNQNGAQFGFSAGTGGDINGDGYSDVIVGAPFYDRGQIDEGNVFGFFGSSTGILFADFIRESNIANAQLGFSVSTAGDVNGDGYSDIIIGAPGANSNKGYAISYLGSASGLQATANWYRISPALNSGDHKFGYCVASAGDVNGDGYSDVILGAPFAGSESGYAYVFHGSSSGLLYNPNWNYSYNSIGQRFGLSVATSGDVNGDGYSDIIVGSIYFGNPTAYFLKGSPTGISGNLLQLQGTFVSTAGDINGDGYSDVITGYNLYSNGEADEGVAFVYHGSSAGLSVPVNWTAETNQAGSFFGHIVSTAGDVNGDGYTDVLVGAPLYDNGETDEGRAFLYNGSAAGLSAVASWFVEGNQINSQLGFSVSTIGDVNGDGYSDVAVGAHLHDANFTDEGRVYVYYGSSSGLPVGYNGFYSGNQTNAQFGSYISTAGDVNGDGYSDMIVSALLFDNGETDEGKVFVYFGSQTGLAGTPGWTAESNQSNSRFGWSVSSAGDINGDAYSDIIIGAPYFDNGQTDEGKVFVYKGSSTGLSSTADWTSESDQAGAQYGQSVACAGDVNGDGYSDIILGAFGFDNGQTNEGRAFVFNGSSSGLPLSPDWTFEPDQAEAYCGFAVSSAGDVNGDGYSDILVGAPLYDNGQFDEGRAFVFNGSDSGISGTASWTGEPDQVQAIYGSALSSAGDVNGDGYSDIIVGAYSFDNGQTDEGRAYVYYGNEGTSKRSTVQQFKPGSSDIVYSGGLTGTNGQVKLNIFGRSPFGRADGKIVYEIMPNGVPFSGAKISNSTSFTGSGNITDMGTVLTGVQLNGDVTGLPINKEYKWRARVQYSPVNNPYQKFGPWKYYTNYIPQPFGCFKAQNSSIQIPPVPIIIILMSQGMFVNSGSYWTMADTIRIQFRQNVSPFAIVDSAKSVIGVSSHLMNDVLFNNAVTGNYYIVIKHRNSIETWSNTPFYYERGSTFLKNFTSPGAAYGDNTIQLIQSETWRGIYSGDENQDGFVNLTDVVNVSNNASVFANGYLASDMNGDNVTDLSDLVLTSNNAIAFVAAVTP